MTGVVPDVQLSSGTSIPQVGFGVFRVPDEATERAVLDARSSAGYRSIDTAAPVRQRDRRRPARLRACGAAPRGAVRLHQAVERRPGPRQHVPRLRGEPAPGSASTTSTCTSCTGRSPSLDRYVETLAGVRDASTPTGGPRAVGVSNFQVAHLQRLLDETHVVPAVNQIELHPGLQQEPLRCFHADHGIVTEAWSPLGQGQALQHPVVAELAVRHGRTPAQVVLRWHLQLGNVVIPQVDHSFADPREPRAVRLRAGRRRHGRARRPRGRRAAGPDPDERDTRPRSGFSSAGGRWVSGERPSK